MQVLPHIGGAEDSVMQENEISVSMQNVLSTIDADRRLRALAQKAKSSADDNNDPAHDFTHVMRVAAWSITILTREFADYTTDETILSIAAALMHDCINLPKNHPKRTTAGDLAAQHSIGPLEDVGFDAADIAIVTDAIATHGFSRGVAPRSRIGTVLQDADRLDSLGAIGMMRLVSVSTQIGASFFDPGDPWAKSRALDDKRFALDHIETKLAKLPAMMHTVTARVEAERRMAFFRRLVFALRQEIGVGNVFDGMVQPTPSQSPTNAQ
jgi:uncharacterized protein